MHFISFPKSGRTWIQLLLFKYFSILKGFDIKEYISGNTLTSKYWTLFFTHGNDNGRISIDYNKVKEYEYEIIFLSRNIYDILISYYNYSKYNLGTHKGDFDSFIYKDNTIYPNSDDRSRHGIWAYVNYSTFFLRKSKVFHVLRYSNLNNEIFVNIYELLTKLCGSVDFSALKKAIEYSSFDNMRTLEKHNTLDWYALQGSGRGAKVRKSNDKYIDYYNKDDTKYIHKIMKDKFTDNELKLLDYSRPF